MRVLSVGHRALGGKPRLRVTSDEPSHTRIERWLVERMQIGQVRPGDKLPPEDELAAALGVSRMTLRQALASLAARGLVERRRGRSGGTMVREPQIEVDLTGLAGFTEQMRRSHVRAGAKVVTATLLAAPPDVAGALQLARGADVFEVVRVRSARGEPLALEETYLPAALFGGLLDRRLTGSLYTIMRRDYDLAPHTAREWLEPDLATAEHAALLGVPVGSPLMLVTRTTSTSAGTLVEYARDRYRPDRTRIGLTTSI